jgi:NAD(P)-dependent dehydrogenase (short-subunit alcohol dehydrogenase family)
MTALLAGATSGMGLETAAQLAESGVPRIVINGRSAARGDAAVAVIRARAPDCNVRVVLGDASDPEVIARLTEAAPTCDLVMHAVPGVVPPVPFEHFAADSFVPLIRTHLISALLLAQSLLPGMIARGGGTMLFVTSDAAKIPTPGESVHGALMAALTMFARTLALETARHGIRVHAITPSIVADTISFERMMADPFSAKLFEKAIARAGLGLPTPPDVAALAVFLASPAAARMTGQAITVNGGLAVA